MTRMFFFFLFLAVVSVVLGPASLEYVLETWTLIAGNAKDIPFWNPITIVLGVLLVKIWVPLAILTWCLSWVLL